jgi:hypothetical protein
MFKSLDNLQEESPWVNTPQMMAQASPQPQMFNPLMMQYMMMHRFGMNPGGFGQPPMGGPFQPEGRVPRPVGLGGPAVDTSPKWTDPEGRVNKPNPNGLPGNTGIVPPNRTGGFHPGQVGMGSYTNSMGQRLMGLQRANQQGAVPFQWGRY